MVKSHNHHSRIWNAKLLILSQEPQSRRQWGTNGHFELCEELSQFCYPDSVASRTDASSMYPANLRKHVGGRMYILLFLILWISLFTTTALAQVTEAWVARYNGPGNSNDGASDLAVDANGNVYVTGISWDSGTSNDYTTIKYDANGNQLWVARYNGPGNGNDEASDLTIDANGNIYVTGTSWGSGTSNDYATIKYDANGNQLWVARYNGSANGGDGASAMSIDTNGNVYVTGSSSGNATDSVTIKYDANGNQLWVARYNGPANYDDHGIALAVDDSGNVYVTGGSYGSFGTYGTQDDYTTIKYDSNGNTVWVARYNGPGSSTDTSLALAIDTIGNVYVTGYSYGAGIGWQGFDYATVKYDAAGNQLWVARYNGPGNDADFARAIAVDAIGNVYVTGETRPSNSATIKYDANGNQVWAITNSVIGATALSIDENGNVYVPGWRWGSGTSSDYATAKYDVNGNTVWVASYNGPANGSDGASAISIDASGNVYVTGGSLGSGTSIDYATVKYSQCTLNTYYQDLDNDTYGNASVTTQACTAPAGYVSDNTDCNDGNASINPSATEVCNGVDDNCNAQIDEGVENTYYSDADSDTYGNPSAITLACSQPSGYVTNNTDCDDSNALINPSAAEVCNGVDDNCNVLIDEGVQNTYYQDSDNDTYGNASVTTLACSQPSGYVTDNTDCDDSSASTYLGALEVCNGVDDNCNTQIDENVTYPYYSDADGDGYGDPAGSTLACSQPSGYVSDNTDCDDADPATYPGATETLNDGIDQDCNGLDLAVEALINAAAGNQQSQTVAWNSVDKEYLVLWQDFRNGTSNPDIYGARLDKNGNVITGNLPVITQTAKQAGPWVSYGGGGYVAVWIDQRNMSTTGTDVYGAWILPDGTVSSEFVVTNAAANQRAASVVYNPSANNFLVTWIDETNSTSNVDVWGAIVNPGGGVTSGPFAMVTATGNQRGPYARYDYGNNRYFMVWFDNRGGNYDVYGSRVSGIGAMLDGSGLVISNAASDQKNARITERRPADGIGNFTLAWIDFRNGQPDIYGALIDEFGTSIGSDIAISSGSWEERAATIDVDYVRTKQAVVGWVDKRIGTDFDIYRTQVDQSGIVSGETLVAGAGTGAANNQQGPLVTYSDDNGTDNGFLLIWRDNRSGVDYDMYGIKVWP